MNISQVHMHAMQKVMLQYSIRAENMFGNINSNILPFFTIVVCRQWKNVQLFDIDNKVLSTIDFNNNNVALTIGSSTFEEASFIIIKDWLASNGHKF